MMSAFTNGFKNVLRKATKVKNVPGAKAIKGGVMASSDAMARADKLKGLYSKWSRKEILKSFGDKALRRKKTLDMVAAARKQASFGDGFNDMLYYMTKEAISHDSVSKLVGARGKALDKAQLAYDTAVKSGHPNSISYAKAELDSAKKKLNQTMGRMESWAGGSKIRKNALKGGSWLGSAGKAGLAGAAAYGLYRAGKGLLGRGNNSER
jgi:hypothetical protein